MIRSDILRRDICQECDYLIGLGFSNYDEQPDSALYPSTWIYGRIETLTGMTYMEAKRLWLDEVVEFLKGIQESGKEAVEQYLKNRGKTPEQALEEIRFDIARIEASLRKAHIRKGE